MPPALPEMAAYSNIERFCAAGLLAAKTWHALYCFKLCGMSGTDYHRKSKIQRDPSGVERTLDRECGSLCIAHCAAATWLTAAFILGTKMPFVWRHGEDLPVAHACWAWPCRHENPSSRRGGPHSESPTICVAAQHGRMQPVASHGIFMGDMVNNTLR